MTPFEALYGYPPPFHIPYFPKDSSEPTMDTLLRYREETINLLKFHLTRVQNRMKQLTNRKRVEREFEIGDWVFMKLQTYAQHRQDVLMLQPRYFGPFQILEKVGVVAYKLDLLNTLIHATIHVSQLKLAYGTTTRVTLLPVEILKLKSLTPEVILERKMVKRRNRAATKLLLLWSGCSKEEATWMFIDEFCKNYPDFHLEVKVSYGLGIM